jgi:hypothetical protein
MLVDPVAKELALRSYGLPECLHVPIAARDEEAIRSYVGEVVRVVATGRPAKALLVRAPPPSTIDRRLPIWGVDGSDIFHRELQVWVHHGYTRYRSAYRRAFPADDLGDRIISQALNRRVAALKGFAYVRVTATSRGANSSAAFSEGWAVTFHGAPEQIERNRRRVAFIQYADLTDLMVMLDVRLGGGVMELVNEGQKLVALPSPGSSEA